MLVVVAANGSKMNSSQLPTPVQRMNNYRSQRGERERNYCSDKSIIALIPSDAIKPKID